MKKLVPLATLSLLVSARAVAQAPMCETADEATEVPLEVALAAYAHEPTVEVIVAAALATLETSPEDARRARRRSRRSGLVPTIRLGATRNRGIDLDTDQNGASTGVGTDADVRIDAQITLDLGRLVYGPDEIAWSRELRAIESTRESRVRDVVEVYFRRRRLQIERDFHCDCSLENAIELASTTALLDVFTDGAFSRIIVSAQESPDARATSAHTTCRSSERRGLER